MYMDISMYEDFFAKRISQLRLKKNVSAREMSLALGQNASYINRIENKKAFPSMQVFLYICEYLNVSPRDFFDYDAPIPEKMTKLINGIYQLDENQFDIVFRLVNELNKKDHGYKNPQSS